ncbi:MAG TPA: acyl-CoA dehydrogenase family protein [Acidimicrobiales bacterium]|nr:acyl-CoA dehydrogenase family protein [Acidimicrobiales bacterium]
MTSSTTVGAGADGLVDGGQGAALPSETEFESEVRAFLDDHAPRRVVERFVWGEGSDEVGLFTERTPEEERADLESARRWANAAFDAGLGWITGPPEYGGRGLPRRFQRIYDTAATDYRIPSLSVYGIGLGMVAPTILAHATDEVKQAYLRPMHRGDIVGCQLFSEPGSGSDLASVQSRAERDGDEWVVNGQKVWTSGAQLSDIGEIICRTDPSLPKHRGLTGFVVDMHAPGVEVRPLRQMTGGASFNEVFFTDVRVPDSHRLGEVNGGWTVALTTLMNERAAIGGGGGGATPSGTNRLVELCRVMGRSGDPLVRQKLADVIVHARVAHYSMVRAMAAVAVGQAPGPELSLSKMALTETMLRTNDLLSLVLGPSLVADSGQWGTYAWSHYVLGVSGMRVAGGTDEVLRNIVGERVLGLPKEPRPG